MNTENKKRRILFLGFIAGITAACLGIPMAAPQNPPDAIPIPPTETAAPVVPQVSATPEPSPTVEDPSQLRLITMVQDEFLEAPTAIINLRFPRLSGESIRIDPFNRFVEDIVMHEADAFRTDLGEWEAYPDMSPVPSTFVSGYSVYNANTFLVSLKLEFVIYMAGAAHPFSNVRTVNFNLREGREISLGEVFKPGKNYLDFLSGYCEDELAIDLGEAFFKEGLAPVEENFQSWGLTREGLVIEFDPYRVAPYASGPQRVLIPFNEMQDWINPDGPASRVGGVEFEVESREVLPKWPTPAP